MRTNYIEAAMERGGFVNILPRVDGYQAVTLWLFDDDSTVRGGVRPTIAEAIDDLNDKLADDAAEEMAGKGAA